jgi:hypothetical protein
MRDFSWRRQYALGLVNLGVLATAQLKGSCISFFRQHPLQVKLPRAVNPC